LSAKLVPTSADRMCHVVSVTDPYGHILGFLDRTCCVNPIDNIHYAPITTTPSTRTKYFTRTLRSLYLVLSALLMKLNFTFVFVFLSLRLLFS
jgi:hypothetical protein